ncbi:transcription initiation factor TFIID subunit 5 [Physcomitrium patens]|uniref:TFIID subunit TAF5 NTD2 domain-containing protein n=1 Tax=Physcomitrium patens TaxID=3218 RepID=A9STW4_PHYPA|nr:transcription initiation factor TFIID subunit 5-like [Physcomitrium patens]XP_024390703.1 transcription initiation factor TFIID subunit 5-like [Physcomitrium patens]PNR44271.1 hypothetical protein PHYPA_016655 [Physcomitrium patens]|eukprot:XP_024390702.1 transcription initiation factor TFIID subunit 5-like [Physcomitrella patens]
MEEEKVEQAVLAYLKSKGYRQAELAFHDEQQRLRHSGSQTSDTAIDSSIANPILFYAKSDNDPNRYKEGYSKLRSWVYQSLDSYKNELLRILYPVFAHCYIDLVGKGFTQEARDFLQRFREDHEASHVRDIQKLEGVLSPQHLHESELVLTLRNNKQSVKMCQYSFELLLQYLHGTDSMLMLGIVNEHLNIHVLPGPPSALPKDDEVVAQGTLDYLNQKEIRWGALEDSLEDKFEKHNAAALLEKDMAGKKDGEGEDNKAKVDGKAGGPSNKKAKKDKASTAGPGTTAKSAGPGSAPRVKAELPMPTMSEEAEKQVMEDFRKRARLGSNALPSVSFYSFINTHNSLNCASISSDGALVAGGFSDSSVKVWDMAKLGEQKTIAGSVTQDKPPTNGFTETRETALEGSKSSYALLQGHAGPVYAASFSPDSEFLLTSSADCTVRLWSMRLKTNLMGYKGHNFPVWDVQYSPVGHYFATASHDRTARIWCMERMQPLRILVGHMSDVDCLQWHVNCNYVATGGTDNTVRLWDVQTGECLRVFNGHCGTVLSLAMSSDGRYMASGDDRGAIFMWDLGSGQCVAPLMGHTSCVWTLAFSGEGSLLASGSADNTVRLWDVNASSKGSRSEEKLSATRHLRLLKTLPTKSTPVYALKFSRTNLLLAAGAFSPSQSAKATT